MKKEMLTLVTYLAKESIEQTAFDGMNAEEKAGIFNAIQKNNVEYIAELKENSVSKEDLAKAMDSFNDEKRKSTDIIMDAIAKQGNAISKIAKGSDPAKPTTLKDVVSDKFEQIKGLSPNTGEVEISKADFGTASIANNTDGTRDLSISELNTQFLTLRDIYPTEFVSGSNNYVYTDWDDSSVTRAADMIAEGGTFPESEAGFIERNISMHKVGDSIPVNAEVWEDEARFGNELTEFLRTNVAIKVNDQLLNGNNTGNNLRGLINSGTTYVPVAAGITDASTWDVAQNMALVMTKLGKKFRASHLVMNATEFYKMQSKKDANNNYATAPFVSADGTQVGSMKIIIENGIPDNQMIALDNRFGKILDKASLTVSRGLVSNQFLTDQETIKVRERLNLLIKESNRSSVQVCTSISAAKTAIEV